MKRKSFLKKATNSFVGRVLRRLLGEEKGAVMMEYIVVGLLIAAACVLAVAFFGNTITGMFASLAQSATGNSSRAASIQNAASGAATADFAVAKAHNDSKISNAAADVTVHTGSQTTW